MTLKVHVRAIRHHDLFDFSFLIMKIILLVHFVKMVRQEMMAMHCEQKCQRKRRADLSVRQGFNLTVMEYTSKSGKYVKIAGRNQMP